MPTTPGSGRCRCGTHGWTILSVWEKEGVTFDFSYCGRCTKSRPASEREMRVELVHRSEQSTRDNVGTSTAPEEAAMRAIGRAAFGIRYPVDD